jgi:hypothetical protein
MRKAHLVALIAYAVTAFLVGCTPTPTTAPETSPNSNAPKASPHSKVPKTSTSEKATSAGGPAKLLQAGFGRAGEYAWVTSLVENTSQDVGQFVTVQFNLLDSSGKILASESQVEQFSRLREKLVLGTQVELPKKGKVAKVAATLDVGDPDDTTKPFPEITASKAKISKQEFGSGWTARFEVMNPTNKALKSPRIGVICYNASHKVIGGGSDFPTLVPPSGRSVVDVDVMTTGRPSNCQAYAGPGI